MGGGGGGGGARRGVTIYPYILFILPELDNVWAGQKLAEGLLQLSPGWPAAAHGSVR